MSSKCFEKCLSEKIECSFNCCRYWIDYVPELNCSLISIEKNGSLTLKEVAERLNISHVRVKQIQDQALKKIRKINE